MVTTTVEDTTKKKKKPPLQKSPAPTGLGSIQPDGAAPGGDMAKTMAPKAPDQTGGVHQGTAPTDPTTPPPPPKPPGDDPDGVVPLPYMPPEAGEEQNAFSGLIDPALKQDRETDVSKLTADIMAEDSQLMQLAETEGLQSANSRGMLNSTMAVGAAQDAAYRVALPMASQNATQAFQSNEAASDRAMTGYLQDDTQAYQSRQSELDRYQQQYLQNNEQSYGWKQSEADREQQVFMQELQNTQQLALQRDAQEWQTAENQMNRDMETYMLEFDRMMQDDRLIAEQQQQVSQMVMQANNNYTQAVANIMANPELSAKARSAQLEAVRQIYQSEMTMVEDLYSVELTFEAGELPTLDEPSGETEAKVGYVDDITDKYGAVYKDREDFYAKKGYWPQDSPYEYENYLIDKYGKGDGDRLTEDTEVFNKTVGVTSVTPTSLNDSVIPLR